MKNLVTVSRYLMALVFIFSGFVKGVDPLGSAYKFHDYFVAFHMGFLEPATLTFAFLLCAAELLIGLLLLFGVQVRLASWGALLFMLIFTPLTLILAIFNPVSDCGCFGDAIHLSNWQTFYKNLVFLTAALILFYNRKNLTVAYSKVKHFVLLIILIVLAFLPSINGYRHLPAIDFRPYHLGVNIREAMTIPDGAPTDEYKTLLYYQKNGVVKEFDESNYPWQDSTWTFVDSKSILVKKGFTPSINNFSLHSIEGVDITDSILNLTGYNFIAVSSRFDISNKESFKRLSEIYYKAKDNGYGFICVTASPSDQVSSFVQENALPFPIVVADEVTLKTVIRANPGLLLLYNGTIIGKWHWRDFPDVKYFDENLLSSQFSNAVRVSNTRLSVALGLFVILLLVAVVKF